MLDINSKLKMLLSTTELRKAMINDGYLDKSYQTGLDIAYGIVISDIEKLIEEVQQ